MPRQLSLNFNGTPPSSGGGTDRVPPAEYELVVTKTSDPGNKSQNGKPMVVFSYRVFNGPQKGKRLRDNFVMPQTPEDQRVGLARFHAALLALNIRVPADRAFKLDLDAVVGRRCRASVVDGTLPAREGNAERLVSQIDEYVIPKQAAALPPSDDDEEEEEDGEEEEEEEGEEGVDDDEEDVEPAPPAPARARRPASPVTEVPRRRAAAATATATAPRRRRSEVAPPPEEEEDPFNFDDDDA